MQRMPGAAPFWLQDWQLFWTIFPQIRHPTSLGHASVKSAAGSMVSEILMSISPQACFAGTECLTQMWKACKVRILSHLNIILQRYWIKWPFWYFLKKSFFRNNNFCKKIIFISNKSTFRLKLQYLSRLKNTMKYYLYNSNETIQSKNEEEICKKLLPSKTQYNFLV